jgi:phosphomannomutase
MSDTPLFGTDGVRGLANVDLTADMAFGLARAAGDGRTGSVVVGRDTRRSGQMLSAAVQAGFNASGFDTVDVGIIPVGGVSHLIGTLGADFGVMVSASHNPAADNGIKFFGPDGSKLDDVRESAIEARFRHGEPWQEISGPDVGIQITIDDAVDRYVRHLLAQADHNLSGIGRLPSSSKMQEQRWKRCASNRPDSISTMVAERFTPRDWRPAPRDGSASHSTEMQIVSSRSTKTAGSVTGMW